MNVRPVFFRSPDDDGAPLDYSYVPSVSEGRRRQQEQAIHQKDSPSAPIVRPPTNGTRWISTARGPEGRPRSRRRPPAVP